MVTWRRWVPAAAGWPARNSPTPEAALADAFAVATPLLAPDGSLIAAISAAVDASAAEELDNIGEKLEKAVAGLGPRYGLKLG
ncbi:MULTISPECIES: hypothetical protein [unclassified Rhodococcus (in: high G+C Gram-positive bacteria)]|uniref:hypothetical protein n=1 Tax=unclassified Rhodococcus (in: high G+C Gram-positive bacteria) TaxID=192944 RepID=UPI0020788DBF|nr:MULTISPECIES: hypothetical protein [unclassified Rhodococcus (in: high G+C Gram-positive bacteria)]